jgi:twitching motility protein PilT
VARIDSILSIVDRMAADELRLGSDREPQMFAGGAQKRLAMPKTSTETVRELLGELLPADREKTLLLQGQVQFLYESPALGPFRVTLTRRSQASAPLEVDAIFHRGRGKAAPQAAPAPVPPLASPAPVLAPQASIDAVPRPTEPAAVQPSESSGAVVPSAQLDSVSPELATLLGRAVALQASDLHLADGEAPLIRVDGALRPMGDDAPSDLARLFGAAITDEARRRAITGRSVDLAVSIPAVGRFRLNVYQTSAGLTVAARALASAPPPLAELGLPIAIDDLIDLPHGLVLFCGATGSGKSTTLAALANEALRRRPSLLITLEDPIEYVLPRRGARGVSRQRQVGRDVRDFATGLRDALREDPDMLLIGEMRDPETISLALTAAETGHLVLASLHSRSAASAVERIIDSYPPERQQQIRVQLADALRAVIVQRLVPRASGEGRVLALEVLRTNHAIASAIREAKTAVIQSAIQSGKREGMISLERCLADLVQRQRITLEAARSVANDPSTLVSYLTPGHA